MVNAMVTRAYTAQYPDPLRGMAGDTLTLGKMDPEWGFVFATHDATGKDGWVPPMYLDYIDRSHATLRRDYDAREMTVANGETIVLLEFVLGWLWAEDARGNRGWIPKEHLEIAPDAYAALVAEAQRWS
jgi:hypothetical protein